MSQDAGIGGAQAAASTTDAVAAALGNAPLGMQDTSQQTPPQEVTTTPVQQQQTQAPSKLNPAWNGLLEKLPPSFHPSVTPILSEWDQNYQKSLEKVQSQYAPYQEFVENQVSPEDIQVALGIMQQLNENPQGFYQQMGDFLDSLEPSGGAPDQGQQYDPTVDLGGNDFNIEEHPKFKELMNNQQVLAQALMQQREEEQLARHNAQIDADLAEIKTAHPDINEVMVLQLALGKSITLKEAADELVAYNESILTSSQRPPAPRVFNPAGGGTPAPQAIDPKSLDDKGRRSLVAEVLKAQLAGG